MNADSQIFVRVKSGKQEVSEVSLGKLSSLTYDLVTTRDVDLAFPAKDRARSTPTDLLTKSLGKVSLRLLVTCGNGLPPQRSFWSSSDTIPQNTGFGECTYHDTKEMKHRLKTGDLLLFHESGLLGDAMSLATNSPFSRVGMVFRLPDKYTGREKVFLLEITQNPQKAINVVTELPTNGICLFRLWERLHSMQGGNVWLLPLTEPLREDPLHNMIDFAERALASAVSPHLRQNSSTSSSSQTSLQGVSSTSSPQLSSSNLSSQSPLAELTPNPSADFLALLQEIGIKDAGTYKEWASAPFCAHLLKIGGKRLTAPGPLCSVTLPKDPAGGSVFTSPAYFTPASLVAHTDVFDAPILLRNSAFHK